MRRNRGSIVAALVLLAAFTPNLAAQQQPSGDFVAGLNALNAADYQDAMARLQKTVQAQPGNEAAHYYLGVANFHLEQYPEALAAFREAEHLAPARPGVRLYIGHIYARQGAFDEAITAYEEELAKLYGPQRADALVALGSTLAQADRLRQARETLAQAVYYDPKYVEALYYYGHVFLQLDQPEQALEQFEKAREVVQEWNDKMIRLGRLSPEEARRQQTTEESVAQEYGRAETFAQELMLWPNLNKAIGDAYMAQGEWTEARNAYRRALRRDELGNPSDPDVYVRIGRALLEDAREMFYEEGLLFSAIPMTKEAVGSAEKALELDANFAPAHELLGEAYALQASTYASDPDRNIVSHTLQDALAEFDKALTQDLQSVRAMVSMARTYLDRAERLAPGSAEVLTTLREADRLIRDALELAPDNTTLYVQMARLAILQENYEAALETAQYALELKPDDVAGLNAAGLAAYYMNDLPKAIRYFTEAIRINPKYAQSYTNLGNAFFQIQSWYRARRQYKKALERMPEAVLANTAYQRAYMYYMIGLCYHETQDYDHEVKALNDALALDSTYFDAYRQLGRAYLARRDYRASRRVLEIAIQNAPSDPQAADVHTQIGEVCEVEGDTHAAVVAYSAALEVDPNNPVAAAAISRLSQS